MPRAIPAFCLAVLAVWPAISHADDPLVLVRNGATRALIAIPENAPANITGSARDLAGILGRMTGAEVPVADNVPPRGRRLVIGPREADSALPPLAYHVQRDGDVVYLSGGSDQGAVNAVYAFLREIGCRWYAPGPAGEVIPRRGTLEVGDLDLQDAPDFESVSGFGGYPDVAESRLWIRRNLLEGFPPQFHSHNWAAIIPPDQRQEHPEWFALNNGARMNQLCTTHPHVIAEAIRVAGEYFDANPEALMFSLSPNDNGRFCQCERCRALADSLGVSDIQSPTGTFSDMLVYFCNQVAEGLEADYPDKRLAFYAYISHTDAPRVVRPHRMLIPVACHTVWDYCPHHPIEDTLCARNRSFAESIMGWNEVASQVYIYEYYGHYHWYGPYGLVHSIRRDMPWLRRHGVVGFHSETHANWWTQGLNLVLPSRLAWDLDMDVDAFVAEYHRDLFGPAAEPIAEYHQMWEDLIAGVPYSRDDERAFVRDINLRFLTRCDSLLTAAEEAVRSCRCSDEDRAVYTLRLKKVRMGYRIASVQSAVLHSSGDPAPVAMTGVEADLGPVFDEIEADPDLLDVIELPLAKHMLRRGEDRARVFMNVWDETSISDDARRDLVHALREGRVKDVARGLGFVTDWYIAGLFAAPGLEGLYVTLPPEQGPVDLTATYEGRDGAVSWRDISTVSPYGEVDIRHAFGSAGTDNSAAYLYAELENGGGQQFAGARIGSNDGVKLWHNGRLVLVSAGERRLTPDQDCVMLTLTPGRNTFLMKVHNTAAGFGASMRILDRNGRPIAWAEAP